MADHRWLQKHVSLSRHHHLNNEQCSRVFKTLTGIVNTDTDVGGQLVSTVDDTSLSPHTEPKVWFAPTSYTVQEPLSNFEVDQRYAILSLRRSGDTSGLSTVAYITLADSALPGEHYVPVNGTVQFEPGDETRNITIPLLASEDSHQVSFTVRLLGNATTHPSSAPPPAVVLEQDEANVVVLNTPVAGVLFPDRPVVLSLLPNGSFATGSTLYYNAPLICIDVSVVTCHGNPRHVL